MPAAILKMGQVLFPDAWTGNEDAARSYINRCSEPEPTKCPEDVISDATGTGPIDSEIQGKVRYVQKDGSSEIVSYEEALRLWEADKDALFEAWQSEGEAWERWHSAANELRGRLCCDGVHSILLTDDGTRIPRGKKHWESYFGEQLFSPLSDNFSHKLDVDGKEVSTRCFLLKERFSDLIAIEPAEDPFDTPWWNQTMALAWIYHQDKNLVRLASERGEHNDYHWPDVALPNELEDDSKMDFDEIMRDRIIEIFLSPSAAHDKLRHHLMAGEIEAWGRKDDGGDLTQIPAVQWSGLKFYFGNPPYVGPTDHTRVDATSWHDVQFKKSEILNNWPLENMASPGQLGTVPAALYNGDRGELPLRSARPFGFSDFGYFTFKRLAEAWVESQPDVPTLKFEEIYGNLWDALWDGLFDDKLIMVRFAARDGDNMLAEGPIAIGLEQYQGEEARYNAGDMALRFQDIIRKANGVDRHFELTELECKKVSPSLLVDPEISVFRHDNIGIYRIDFIECWSGAGKELPWFIRDAGKRGKADTFNEDGSDPKIKEAGTIREAGRPKNSYSLEESDAPLVEKMRCLLRTEKSLGNSIIRAARMVVGEAAGDGSEESKAKRLQRRYTKKYGNGA